MKHIKIILPLLAASLLLVAGKPRPTHLFMAGD